MISHRIALRFNRRERGIATFVTAVSLIALVPIVGLSIDAGIAFVIKGRLSAAMDSSALAAGRNVNLTDSISTAQANALTAATNFFNANFPSGYMDTLTTNRTITPTFTELTNSQGNYTGILQISMTGTVQMNTFFMRWFGISSIPISSTGTATRRNMVMSLVLDKSSSMGTRDSAVGTIPAWSTINSSSSSCEAMVAAAAQFVSYFSPYDYIGEVSFDYTAHNDFTPSTSWAGSSGVAQQIGNIQCGNNTNTTAALAMAYNQITGVGQQLAENEIVLFTDGVPNAVDANFPVRTSADTRYGPSANSPTPPTTPSGNQTNCADTTGTLLCNMPACTTTSGTVKGALVQWANFSVSNGTRMALYPIFNTDPTPTSVSGCPSSPNMTMANQTLAYIPNTDSFGNSMHGPWDDWIYQVNNHCAPSGTPITPEGSLCKNMGGLFSAYPGVGVVSSNFYTSGPYSGYFRNDVVNTIGAASMNSAMNEANAVRSDTNYNITINTVYLQGNGSDPVDRAFLQYVSNQQNIQPLIYDSTDAPYTSSYYNSAQQTGVWVATTDQTQLYNLFSQVASSLLRISQ